MNKLIDYVQRSQNYDGGIGLGPGLESHGGSTYCAVAALALLGVPLLEVDTPSERQGEKQREGGRERGQGRRGVRRSAKNDDFVLNLMILYSENDDFAMKRC